MPAALSPELFDLLCEMRLQISAHQKQHTQLRQELSAEMANLWRAVRSGGTSKSSASGAAWQVPRLGGLAQPAPARGAGPGGYYPPAGGAQTQGGGNLSERERVLEERLLELEAQLQDRVPPAALDCDAAAMDHGAAAVAFYALLPRSWPALQLQPHGHIP